MASLRTLLLGGLSFFALGIGGYSAFAFATASGRLRFPDHSAPNIQAATDPARIAEGRYLATTLAHCNACHSTDDRNGYAKITPEAPLSGGLEFAMGPIATTWAANLTPDATGIANRSDAELARAIRHGVLPDGRLSIFMTLSASKPSDHDLSAILGFLRSQAPVARPVEQGRWGPLGTLLLPFFGIGPSEAPAPTHVPRAAEPTLERGRYLADNIALCTSCHSAWDMSTFQPVGPKAAGSAPDPSHGDDTDMEFVAPNLTSDPSGLTGQWTEDVFVQRIREGRRYGSSIMPWEGFKLADEVDLRSIYRYLKSLPPVSNDLGPTYRKKGWTKGDPVTGAK